MDPQTAIQITTHFAAMLLGIVIAHWLRLSGDRRREYNELADQVFEQVNQTLTPADAGWFALDRSVVMQLRRRMGLFQRWQFDRAVAELEKIASRSRLDFGETFFDDPEGVNRALQKIAKSVPRR